MKRQAIPIALVAVALLIVISWRLGYDSSQTPPTDPQTLVQQAISDLDSGSTVAAIEKLERALETLNTAEAHYYLGNAYAQRQHYTDAEEHYLAALKLDPDHLDARANLSVVYYNLGHLAEAEEQIRLVLNTQPTDAELRYNLGGILLAQNRLQQAEAEFLAANQIDPDLAEVYLGFGRLYYLQGRSSQAAASLETFLSITDDPVWRAQAEDLLEEIKQP